MASLSDTIRNNLAAPGKQLVRNAQGQLVEQAVPISQLAGQSGLTAPPTTPGSAAALGASPDSAKMAGTPGQLASAIRQSTDSVNTLAEAQADKRYRSSLTAEEQTRADTQKKLSAGLSDSVSKVKGLIDTQVAKLAPPPPPASTTPTAPVPVGTDTPEYAKYTQDLASWNTTSESNKVIQSQLSIISKELGRTPPTIRKNGVLSRNPKHEKLYNQLQDTQSKLVDLGPMPTVPTVTAPPPAPITTLTTPTGMTPIAGKSQADVDTQWKIASSDPDTQKRLDAMDQLQQLTGKSTTELSDLARKATESQLGGAAKAGADLLDSVTVSSLFTGAGGTLSDGITKPADLASMLGIPIEQLNAMTIDQLDEAVNALGQTTQQTQQQSNNALLSASERAAYAEQAINEATSGAAAIDQQLNTLGAEIEKADQISFLGKTGSVKDLLSDESISQQITDLVTGGKWKDLPDTDPLKQFIGKYEGALKSAAAVISSTGESLNKIQEGNKAAFTYGNTTLSPALMSQLLGIDVSKIGTSPIDINKSPLLKFARGLPAAEADILFNEIGSNTALAAEINKLSPREISELGIGRGGPKWESYKKGQENWSEWNKIGPDDIDGLLAFTFDPPMSKSDAADAVGNNYRRIQAGLTGDERLTILDPDRDGRLGPLASLRTSIEKSLGPKNLASAAGGKVANFAKKAGPPTARAEATPEQTAMINYLTTKPRGPGDMLTVMGRSPGDESMIRLIASSGGPYAATARTAIEIFDRTAKEKAETVKAAADKKAVSDKIDASVKAANTFGSPNSSVRAYKINR